MKLKRITTEEIAEYGVVNAPDKLVGNPHDNKMIFDRLIREVVAGAINALIDQWEELDEAEDQRDEAEEQREAAEQARQEAENLRQNTFREEIEEAKGHEEGAYRAMNLAAENAHWSEAFAVGKENGVDIDSTNPAYRNNAKFYAEQAKNLVGGDDVFVCPNILVSAADWSASTKYDDFPWEATAQVKDINGQHVPFVVFDHVDAATYGLATVADTADESLTIYSVKMPERDILIPVTVFMSEGAIQSAWKALSGGKEGEVLAKQSGKDHDFKWMPISGLGAGLDGERGLAIYRANKPWSEWTSEYFSFADFVLPADYKPKQNDLVLTSNNYLCWIYSVDENAQEAVVASFMPAVSLNGGPGPAGDPGVSPNISILPGERDEEDGTVRYGTIIEVTNPDESKVYAFVPDGRDGDPGPAGADGKDGKDGKDGEPGKDGRDGEPGPAGANGKDGAQGKDGERGLAIYRANKPWSDWSSEYFDFSDFQLPNGYVPRVNDLVLTSNNYLCWIYEVNAATDTFLVASFSPPANLNGGPGPAGVDGKDGQDGEPGPAGADGKDGADGAPGKDGKDGADGKEGERGLAIYRCSQAMYGMTSDTINFTKFQLPVGYVPKVNDLVITADNYLYYVYQVNATTDEITLASFYPPVNLNGAEGTVGADGEKGDPGERGTGILAITTTPSAYTTEINGLTPAYRIALSTVTTQAKVSKVLVGDIVQRSYYHYPVIYVDGSYVYCGTRVSIRGETGAAGTPGEPGPAGDPGEKGEPGDTPYIGSNGNWWIGGTDTGVGATGSGSGGASVQADWGENDETKLSHIKGRTHWKEEFGGDVIVPETTKTFDGYYVTLGGSKLGIVEGTTYIVQFNGEEYTVVGQNYKGDMIMGNAHLIDADGEDTEEPFVITWIGGTNYYLTRRKSNPRTLTVSVTSKEETIYHKLEHGYLPEGVPYTEESLVELLPEVEIAIDPDSMTGVIPVDPPELAVGQIYTVTWNGAAYECVGQEFNMPMDDGSMIYVGVCLGDLGGMMGGDSTGEPFVFAVVYPSMVEAMGATNMIMALDGSASVTMGVAGLVETVHPVPGKFMPEGTPWIDRFDDVILPEMEWDSSAEGIYYIVGDKSPVIDPTKTYNINYNGVLYERRPTANTTDMPGYVSYILGRETDTEYAGLPFSMTLVSPPLPFGEKGTIIGSIQGREEVTRGTVSIVGGYSFSEIAPMLVPADLKRIVVRFEYDESSDSYKTDEDIKRVIDAMKKGIPVMGLAIEPNRDAIYHLYAVFAFNKVTFMGHAGASIGRWEWDGETNVLAGFG